MADYGFALEVQQLRREGERVLVIAELVGQRNGDGWFTPVQVTSMFREFRLPPASNTSARLSELRTRGLVLSRARTATQGPAWSLTPLGHQTVLDLIGKIDLAELSPEIAAAPGADFGSTHHTILPPALAPLGWQAPINALLTRSPFDRNVLCMTRFESDEPDDPIGGVINTVRDALGPHGLNLHLASDRIVDEDLWGNVAAYTWACRYGIGLVEDRVGEGVNDNLKTEVGAMLIAGRRCTLLKDRTAPETLWTDLIGRIYKPVNFDDLAAVAREVHWWAADDLGLGTCGACPPRR